MLKIIESGLNALLHVKKVKSRDNILSKTTSLTNKIISYLPEIEHKVIVLDGILVGCDMITAS